APIIITDTPYPGQDVPTCLSQALSDVSSCTFPRTKGIRESRQATNIAVAVDNGAQYLDISNWVCDLEICPVISGNLLMYRDSNHITTAYAEWLTPFFDAAVGPYVDGLRLRLPVP
ncbi:MAG: SGNH hydrolase domain-containing protein, partial [Actinomycetota bacterium]